MSDEVEVGTCAACGAPAERGPSGAWWHLQQPSHCAWWLIPSLFVPENPFVTYARFPRVVISDDPRADVWDGIDHSNEWPKPPDLPLQER